MRSEMAGVEWFSFTTDIWSTEVSTDALLSLSAHWLTESVLHTQTFPGSHIGEAICEKCREILAGWGIRKEQLHLIVRDNVSNMVMAM